MLARCALLLLCVVMIQGRIWSKNEDKGSIGNDVLKALRFMKNKASDKLQELKERRHHHHHVSTVRLTSFSWENCGSSSDLAVVHSLSVSDPLHIPGNVTVSFSGDLKQALAAPLEVNLEIKKKELFWIPVPCIDNLGSCDYQDICPLMAQVACPPLFKKYNIPCTCPFNKGSYKLPASSIPVDTKFDIPSWLEKGDFKVQATMKHQGQQVFCVKIDFTIA